MRSTTTTRPATSLVTLGIDRLLEQDAGLIAGQRIGLVSNPASVDASFTHSADRLREWDNATLVALFGPQHGFRSNLQDNMIETPHGHDCRRGVPVYSLYSETREPTAEMLRDVDVLVVDLQDVGTRVYTFIYTMANCMRAAARHGVRVVVCDRPNPIGGDAVEGSLLAPAVVVVRRTVPHSAAPRADDWRAGKALQRRVRHRLCARCRHARGMAPRDVLRRNRSPLDDPSPNLPTLDSAIVYPGAVLFEGTMLSEGRGTTRPFELIGAPWIDGERLADAMNAARTARRAFPRRCSSSQRSRSTRARLAAAARSTSPTARAFKPVRTSVELLAEFHREDPARFAWRQPPYEYERARSRSTSSTARIGCAGTVDGAGDVSSLISSWSADEERFRKQRERYLLY